MSFVRTSKAGWGLILLTLVGAIFLPAADLSPALVQPEGAIIMDPVVGPRSPKPQPTQFNFHLPGPGKSVTEWRAPIAQLEWETNAVRYTETVLQTRLGPGPLTAEETPATRPVLVVQVVGESFTNIYAEASAGLTVTRTNSPLWLELCGGVIRAENTNGPVIAVIEIPSSGLETTKGRQLRFRGSMPPAATGSMIIKIPRWQPVSPEEVERLEDLDFAEEFARVKSDWGAGTAPGPERWPVQRERRP